VALVLNAALTKDREDLETQLAALTNQLAPTLQRAYMAGVWSSCR